MNYYQHHIGDFIRDTSRLNNDQCMAYLRLIWMYYESEEPLTGNIRVLSLRVGCSESDTELLLEAFFSKDGNVWRHTRCDREIGGYKRMSDGGKQGAAKRWGKGGDGEVIGGASPAQCTPNANQEPITNNQGKPKKQLSYSDDFLMAWDAYPNRPGANKADSYKAWKARISEGVDPESMISGSTRYAAYCAATVDDPKFIKQPKTFFGPDKHYLSDWTIPQQAIRKRQMSASDESKLAAARTIFGTGIEGNQGNEPFTINAVAQSVTRELGSQNIPDAPRQLRV